MNEDCGQAGEEHRRLAAGVRVRVVDPKVEAAYRDALAFNRALAELDHKERRELEQLLRGVL